MKMTKGPSNKVYRIVEPNGNFKNKSTGVTEWKSLRGALEACGRDDQLIEYDIIPVRTVDIATEFAALRARDEEKRASIEARRAEQRKFDERKRIEMEIKLYEERLSSLRAQASKPDA